MPDSKHKAAKALTRLAVPLFFYPQALQDFIYRDATHNHILMLVTMIGASVKAESTDIISQKEPRTRRVLRRVLECYAFRTG